MISHLIKIDHKISRLPIIIVVSKVEILIRYSYDEVITRDSVFGFNSGDGSLDASE